jgi:hypothetical protein
MASKFDICSRALNSLGEDTINSFTENTSRSKTCGLVYPQYIRYLQSIHPWNFNLKKVQLGQLVTTPLNEWTYAYQLPSDNLKLKAVYDSSAVGVTPTTNYEIFEDQLFTDHDKIYIDYQFEVAAENFPIFFEEFVVDAIAAKIARSITDDANISEEKKREAWGLPSDNMNGGSFGKAKKLDSTENPSQQIPADDLLAARLS